MPRLTIKAEASEKFKAHKREWLNCRRCNLHRSRHKVVLVRGQIPADILFIGEAPGLTEDTIGYPFVGPSGQLLDQLIEESLKGLTLPHPSYAVSNVVACIPKDEDGTVRAPTLQESQACCLRLERLQRIILPKECVTLGKIADQYYAPLLPCKNLIHPSAILRMDGSQQLTAIKRFCIGLREVFERVKHAKETYSPDR